MDVERGESPVTVINERGERKGGEEEEKQKLGEDVGGKEIRLGRRARRTKWDVNEEITKND